MADDKKNVFISHVHEDDAGLGKIKDLLKKHGLEIRDSSINSSNPNNAKSPDYIKSQILAPQINWASTLLVYITPKTKGSDWVDWEIEYAQKQGKRIVGVWAHGHNECEVPDALKDYADAVVNWNGPKIIDAINGKNNDWQNPDGTPCIPRPIKRYSCG
jgi:hypothetical protein